MSEEMKPCPFCGGEAVMCGYQDEMLHYVKCRDCGACSDGAQLSAETAAAAWNRRAERTCTLEWRDDGEGYAPNVRCSACGGWLDAVADVEDVALFEFCPMCGARVEVER